MGRRELYVHCVVLVQGAGLVDQPITWDQGWPSEKFFDLLTSPGDKLSPVVRFGLVGRWPCGPRANCLYRVAAPVSKWATRGLGQNTDRAPGGVVGGGVRDVRGLDRHWRKANKTGNAVSRESEAGSREDGKSFTLHIITQHHVLIPSPGFLVYIPSLPSLFLSPECHIPTPPASPISPLLPILPETPPLVR